MNHPDDLMPDGKTWQEESDESGRAFSFVTLALFFWSVALVALAARGILQLI